MEGPVEPRNAASASEAGRLVPELRGAFCSALAASDMRGARRMIGEAAEAGLAPGRLYVEVIRPALAERQQIDPTFRRLAAEIGDSIVADLSARVPPTGTHGTGRAALLSCRDDGVEGVDGNIAVDFLEADGWSMAHLLNDSASPTHTLEVDGGIDLAVVITAGPEDALRLAPMCTALRHLADPPVILLCDFTGRAEHRAAIAALGADAVARDPGELLKEAASRLPGPGLRRWGVRLQRREGALILAPTGRLDAISVGRLAEVATSRVGTFSRLVIDLRDLAEIDESGMSGLGRPPWTDLAPVVWSDARTLGRMAGIDHGITLTAAD